MVFSGAQPSRFLIKQLPPELLVQVMYWWIRDLQEQARSSADRKDARPTPYAWLTIRHVCKFWRDVALQHPQLGSTTIYLTRYDCIQEAMRLSGNLHIYVYQPSGVYGRSFAQAQALFALVLDNLHRTVVADIQDLSWFGVNDPYVPKTLQPVPILTAIQSLTWTPCISRDVAHAQSARGTVVLPVFSFPNLQHLCCHYVNLPSIRHMLHRGLLHLELHDPSELPIPEDDLLAALEEMPFLESLVLHELRVRGTSEERRAVHLPCLRKLNIAYVSDVGYEDPEIRLYVLRYINYPPTASISATFPWVLLPSSSPVFVDLAAKLNVRAVQGYSARIQSMAVDVYGHLVVFRLWSRLLSSDYMRSLVSNPPSPETEFSLSVSFRCQEDWITNVLDHIPLSDVRSAHFSERQSGTRINPIPLRSIIASMPHVESLSLRYEVHPPEDTQSASLVNATPISMSTHIDEELEHTFPRLKMLFIHEDYPGYSSDLPNAEVDSDVYLTARRLLILHSHEPSPLSNVAVHISRDKSPKLPWERGTRNPTPRTTTEPLGAASQCAGCWMPNFLSISSGLSRARKVLTHRRS